MRLYLVRHGEALLEYEDTSRPLSMQGREDVARVGQYLKSLGDAPDGFYHSSKLRAAETAEILRNILRPEAALQILPGLEPNDPPEAFAGTLAGWQQNAVVVSHLPFLPGFVRFLLQKPVTTTFVPASVVVLERRPDATWAWQNLISPGQVDGAAGHSQKEGRE